MLVARRSTHLLLSRNSGSILLSRSGVISREYHGDPGPSTRSNQKNLRSALIAASSENSTSGPGRGRHLPKELVNADRILLDGILNQKPIGIHKRPRSERQASLPLRLPESRRRNDRTKRGLRNVFSRNDNSNSRDNRYQNQSDQRDDPYSTAMKLKKWIDKYTKNQNKHQQLSEPQIEEAISIVTDAPKHLVNAPVWNILLGFIGKQRKLNIMWRLYNDMKKRGVKPTTRTYSTMLNAYSRIAHSGDTTFQYDLMPVKESTNSKVTILFQQSQQHIKQCMSASSALKEDLGISSSTGEELHDEYRANQDINAGNEYLDEINPSPTNAYLKYLGRHGLWEEMYQTFISMDTTGPLSPDTVTYTTLFASLHNIHLYRFRQRKISSTDIATMKSIDIGPISRGIWNQCSRQFSKITKNDKNRKLDNELFSHVLRCLIRGRPEDQRFAVNLINEVWGFPPPGQQTNLASTTTTSSSSSSYQEGLPNLRPDTQSATSLIHGLLLQKQNVLASHYTTLLLSTKEVQYTVDIHFSKIAINALSESGDIGGIMNILDSYQPPTGIEGWDLSIYKSALQGARWAGDFNTALNLFKRATQISDKIENTSPGEKTELSEQDKSYKWKTPNGEATDIRGNKWTKPKPLLPDYTLLSILLKISIGSNNESIKKVLNIINYFGSDNLLTIHPGSKRSEINYRNLDNNEIEDSKLIDHTPETLVINDNKRKILSNLIYFSKSVISAIERLNSNQSMEYEVMKLKMQKIVDVWGNEIGKTNKNGKLPRQDDRSRQEDVKLRNNSSRFTARDLRSTVEEDEWEDKMSDGDTQVIRQSSDRRRLSYDRQNRYQNRFEKNDTRDRRDDRVQLRRYGGNGENDSRFSSRNQDENFNSSDEVDTPRRQPRSYRDRQRSDDSHRIFTPRRGDESHNFVGERPRREGSFGSPRDNRPSTRNGSPKKASFGLKKSDL